MALRLRKDIKKSSYYVWFLGAQESRGLRGEEYALPAIEQLERRARHLEPFKLTLQVSHKGLKIVQNVPQKGKQQTIKHFIPHGSITSAVVQGDVVACVLLLFNPITGCPIHVHAYRCDSDRTAEMLCAHLHALIERPENQKKFADIEKKLQMKGALPSKKIPDSSLGSEVSTRESESGSSEERCVANLYDSLAAELKQKLSVNKSPILLPPRDYDTVHRQKGNLSGIETRRCLNQNIVGVNARRKMESSGGSSGIGSDMAPSPDQEYPRNNDNQSTSEEDWAESTAYMMHEAYEVTPVRRALSPRREQAYEPPAPFRDGTADYRDQSKRYREDAKPMREHKNKSYKEDENFRDQSYRDFRDQPKNFKDKSANYRENIGYIEEDDFEKEFRDRPSYERRYRPESTERVQKYSNGFADKIDKYVENKEKYDETRYSKRYQDPKNRSADRLDERPVDRRAVDDRRHTPKLQRGISEGSLAITDASPKDRFNVAKEKFKNLERERFNIELKKHMQIRRNIIERNNRASSPEVEERRPRREDRRNKSSERPERPISERIRGEDRSRRDESERRHDEIPIERQLPRVGRKNPEQRRFEFGAEDYFDRREKPERSRRELDRRIEEDIVEPIVGERRRNWADRQRNFGQQRILEDQRQSFVEPSFYQRDFRDLAEREPNKYRHSYAEPIPRGRLGMAALRPY